MKTIIAIILALLLTGCACPPKTVYIPCPVKPEGIAFVVGDKVFHFMMIKEGKLSKYAYTKEEAQKYLEGEFMILYRVTPVDFKKLTEENIKEAFE